MRPDWVVTLLPNTRHTFGILLKAMPSANATEEGTTYLELYNYTIVFISVFLACMSLCSDPAQCCWKPELGTSCLCVLEYNPGRSLQFGATVVVVVLLLFR